MKRKLCIIYGGESSEHKDSLDSFENIYQFLQREQSIIFNLTHVIFATLSGNAIVNEVDFSLDHKEYRTGEEISLVDSFFFVKNHDAFLFSTLFSQNGEDGRVQGLARLLKIRSNLGEPLQPSLCMSKFHLNRYVEGSFPDLLVPKTYRISKISDFYPLIDLLSGQNIVIKPNSLGSSIYTDRLVVNKSNLLHIENLLYQILKEDKYALLQVYLKGKEYTCGIMNNQDGLTALPVGEVITERSFFGYSEKNDPRLNRKYLLPQEDPLATKIQRISRDLFLDLDLQNIARFDYIVSGDVLFFLECNPFPSLHKYSFFMLMLAAKNISVISLIDKILLNSEK